MKNVRRIGVAVAAAAVSFGLLALSAPAHADTTWGWSQAAVHHPVSLTSTSASLN